MGKARPPIPLEELDEVLRPWEAAWKGLQGARILLAGGTGTLGTWMLELFCRASDLWNLDALALVLSRRPDAFRERSPHLAGHRAVSLLKGNILDLPPLPGPVDLLVHGAADSRGDFVYSDLLGYLDTLVSGTRNLLGRSVEAGARRALLLSSGAIYGSQPPDLARMPEDFAGAPDPLDPGTRYAQGKRMVEHYGAVFHHDLGLEAVVARGFALVGPHVPLDAHFVVGNFIRDALAGGPIQVLGDGTPYRSFLYASDYAMACWLILFKGTPRRA
jgi:dTDP-glucose 4,6-dehydratase